ncbi:hypothetical protein N5079_19630 [Planotetraspora sp. A-T 1434]|uniref:hypothetical protein n=1 Tax=Planotetraspora sp. A-T 1434 TaxID=2979219 RepID=UPI0021C03867|nr:hypothetical protein [Planotetraspora sp. A-T 1434]MCT9932415.1 hypothetical protein [Planotetraspora sp. A-T 1434]
MTADELAPYPVVASEVTADSLARSLQEAAADWHANRAPGDATADVAATALDGMAFLLRSLRMVAPDLADRIAVDAWKRTQDGPPEGWPAHEMAQAVPGAAHLVASSAQSGGEAA